MSRWLPLRFRPKQHEIVRYAVAIRCPVCGLGIIVVWKPHLDGSYGWIAVEVGSWHGESTYVPRKHRIHSRSCRFGRPPDARSVTEGGLVGRGDIIRYLSPQRLRWAKRLPLRGRLQPAPAVEDGESDPEQA